MIIQIKKTGHPGQFDITNSCHGDNDQLDEFLRKSSKVIPSGNKYVFHPIGKESEAVLAKFDSRDKGFGIAWDLN